MPRRRRQNARHREPPKRPHPHPSPLPPPEEVFLDWLVSVAGQPDIEVEARLEAARIDGRAPWHPDAQRLRTLLLAVAGAGSWPRPVSSL